MRKLIAVVLFCLCASIFMSSSASAQAPATQTIRITVVVPQSNQFSKPALGYTVTWPTPWADTNYTVVCSVDDSNGGTNKVAFQDVGELTTDDLTAYLVNWATSGGNRTVTIHCIGVHD